MQMGSRSLRTFNGLPRVTGVGCHTMAFEGAVSQRRLSTLRFSARLRTMCSEKACVGSSRTLWLLSPVVCETACTVKLHVVVATSEWAVGMDGNASVLLDLEGFDLVAYGLYHSFCSTIALVAVSL